ncbi:MAG: hypothetical protein KGI98_16635, partial [Euryarchaeota archaeon]|nr:hypothetical protein [Euryarchaeota archaeon]
MPEPLDDPRGWDLSRTKHLTVSSELARPTGVRPCRRVPELPRSLHQALTPAAFIGLFLLVVVLVLPSGSLVLAASSSSVAGPQATPTGASTGEVYTLPLSLRGLGIPVYTGPYTVNYQPGTLQHMERLGTYTPPKMAPALTSSKPLLPLGASGPLVYSAGSGWNGISSAAPNPCGCTPPDTINAVGDGYVFEMVNTEGWIWTTTGTSVSEFTLATFFGTTQGLSDPQIMYDPISGRWFGEIISVSKPYGNVFLAVSQTSNPSGSWNQYMLTGPVSGNLPDQCIIAVDSNAIILSSDYFKGNTFLGALYFVANKSQAMGGGATPAYVTIGPQKVFGSMHPAYELTNSSTFFMTSDGDNVAGSPTQLNWMTLTGAPPNAITTTYANFTTTGSSPTAIPQPGGTHAISTDQRIGSSVYQNGRIYAAAFSATCSGGSLDCLHIWNLTVSGTTPTMQGDFAWSPPGGVSGYYPAVSLDSQGFLGVIYTTSSSTMYPSAAITGQERGDSPTSLEAPTVTQAGTANQGTTRFGDYSGMETDCLTNSFWGSVEYDASGFTWNTWVQSLSFSSNLDVTVDFSETGLPAGTNWTVVFNGYTHQSTTSDITFQANICTRYSYSILTPVPISSGIRGVLVSPNAASTEPVGIGPYTVPVVFGQQYHVWAYANPAAGGTVTPTSGWQTPGASVTFTATPNAGYTFSSWSGNGTGSYTGTANPDGLTLTGPITEVANFAAAASHTVTLLVNPTSGGGYLTAGATNYYNGQTLTVPNVGLTISETTNAGWHWVAPYGTTALGGVTVTGNTLTATGNGGTLYLNFTHDPLVTYAMSTPAACGGTLTNAINTTGTVANFVNAGTSNFFDAYQTTDPYTRPLNISAPACAGYTFTTWGSGPAISFGSAATNAVNSIPSLTTNATLWANYTATVTYVVSFAETGVQAWYPTWSVTLNGVMQTAAPGGTISFTLAGGSSYTYVVPTIAVNSWVQDAPSPSSGSGSAAASIAITFQVQDLLTTAVSPAASGSVSPSTGWVADGVGVSISAGPAAGYTFSAWTGTLAARGAYSGSNNPQSVTPTGGGINETADFVAVTSYAVTFSETGVQTWELSWSVVLNGITKTAAPGVSISFTVTTGQSYSYTVPTLAVNAWMQDLPSPASGSGSVAATVAVSFAVQDLLTMAVSPAGSGTVSPGTSWVADGVGVSISAGAASGYAFSGWVGSLALRGAYTGTNDPDTVTPTGGGINETADFVVTPTYAVTFSESGVQTWMPSWGVILNGVTKTAAPAVSITFNVPTGTSYSYTVPTTAVNPWVQDSPSPTIGSGSAAATIAIAFTIQDL